MELLTREHPWYTILPVTGILVYLLTLTGHWQLILAAGIVAGILMKLPKRAFAVAFVAGAAAWGIPLTIASRGYPLSEASTLLLEILGFCPPCFAPLTYAMSMLISAIVTALGALLGAYGYGLLRREQTPA